MDPQFIVIQLVNVVAARAVERWITGPIAFRRSSTPASRLQVAAS